MATRKLSEIAVAGSPPASTDQLVGVTAGTTDNLFSIAQIQSIAGLQKANGNLIFYVSTTGNDSTAVVNDITHPWATGQAASNAASRYDYQVTWGATIQFLDGSYNPTQSSIVPNSFFNIESGGLTIQGHVGDATKVTLTSQIQMNTDITVVTFIGWLTFNLNSNSCINPQNGGCVINGDMIFTGTATPFYLEGISQIFIAAVNITVTSSTLQYFLFVAPGVAEIQGGCNIILPGSLTVSNGFFTLVGAVDQTDIGVAMIQMGTVNWTNFGGVSGPRLENAVQYGVLRLPNGELTDIPGTSNYGGRTDGTVVIEIFNRTKAGTLFSSAAGFPATANIPQQAWRALHDSSGVNTYLAANNAGSVALMSARFPLANANLNFYVATTGSDSNPGTVGSPFATIQHAVNFAALFDYQGVFFPTINVAAGTYTLAISGTQIVLPELFGIGTNNGLVVGDTVTPANVVLNDTHGTHTVDIGGPDCIWEFSGFQMNSPGGGVFRGFNYATLQIDNITFNNTNNGAFYAPLNFQGPVNQISCTGTWTFSSAKMGQLLISRLGCSTSMGSFTINLAANTTITSVWFDMHDKSNLGFAFVTIGNKATSAGQTASLFNYTSILTQNGLESDLPGTNNTIAGDASSSLGNIGTHIEGFFANKVAHLPANTDIVESSWNVFKDSSGGTVNLAYNDAGTMALVQLGGLSVTITTAALTGPGTQGSMTFTNGVLTAQTPAT